jgi:uncharacterized protein (TIGR03083 family)
MDLSDAELDELLGAYALDALDPDEQVAVERYLARTPSAADEVERLRTAAAWIGASEALAPPSRLRATLLDAARGGPLDEALAGYTTEAARFDAIVDEVPAGALDRTTANGLGIHHLVIHLAAMESLLAATLGEPVLHGIDETDVEARTARFVECFGDRPVDDALDVWRAAVAAVRRWAEDPAHSGDDVACFGLVLSRDSVLLTRAFEIWTHADDIRRELGRPAVHPEPVTLHRMANMSVTATPIGLEVIGRAHRGKSARVVLTGPGGGSWLIPLGMSEVAEPADVVVTLDTVDWCLLVAERIAPDALAYEATGDSSLVPDLVAAASAFAML